MLSFQFVVEKFDSIQVNAPVADFSADSNRLFGAGILELDVDITSHGQVGCGEEANSAFAQSHAPSVDDPLVGRMIDDDPNGSVKRVTLPAAAIYLWFHPSNFRTGVPGRS